MSYQWMNVHRCDWGSFWEGWWLGCQWWHHDNLTNFVIWICMWNSLEKSSLMSLDRMTIAVDDPPINMVSVQVPTWCMASLCCVFQTTLWSVESLKICGVGARMLVGLKRLKKKLHVATAYTCFCNSNRRTLDLVLSWSLAIMQIGSP